MHGSGAAVRLGWNYGTGIPHVRAWRLPSTFGPAGELVHLQGKLVRIPHLSAPSYLWACASLNRPMRACVRAWVGARSPGSDWSYWEAAQVVCRQLGYKYGRLASEVRAVQCAVRQT